MPNVKQPGTAIARRLVLVGVVTALAVSGGATACLIALGGGGASALSIVLSALLGVSQFAVLSLVWWLTVRNVLVRRFGHLREAVAVLDAGRLNEPVVYPLGDELLEFAQRIDALRLELDQAQRRAELAKAKLDDTNRAMQAVVGSVRDETGSTKSLFADPMETAQEMVNRLDPDLHWLASSRPEIQFLGWPLEQLQGMRFPDIVHAEDREAACQAFQKAIDDGEMHGLACRVVLHDRSVRHVQVNAAARYDAGGTCIAVRCHMQDETEKVRAQQALRQRTEQLAVANAQLRKTNQELERLKNRYSDLYHNSPAMYYTLDADGKMTACNDRMATVLGYGREELVGRPYTMLLADPDAGAVDRRIDTLRQQGRIEQESRWRRKDGCVIDVQVRASAMLDEQGRFVQSRDVAQDVTERRQLSIRLAQEAQRLAEANALLKTANAELDDFTYVVSHDLKEPLRTIEAFSRFLMEDYRDRVDEQGRQHLQYLRDASMRLRLLIDQVLTLSRIGRVANVPERIEMTVLLNEVRSDLDELLRTRGASLVVPDDAPPIWADRQRLAEVFRNLITNGIRYNQSEAPTVEIGWAWSPPRESSASGGAGPDTRDILFSVRDNGIGIEPGHQDKIFKLFQRLHRREQYEGTGAGLAICKRIVEAHGGQLTVASEVGQGSTFRFSIATRTEGPSGEPPVGG